MTNVRAKGMRGEHEFREWLFRKGIVNTMPDRNLEQVRHGGIDLVPKNHPFAYEVKRVENITSLVLDKWWAKAMIDCSRHNKKNDEEREPVVAFRKTRGDWMFLISVEKMLGLSGSYAIVKAPTFVKYVSRRVCDYGT